MGFLLVWTAVRQPVPVIWSLATTHKFTDQKFKTHMWAIN